MNLYMYQSITCTVHRSVTPHTRTPTYTDAHSLPLKHTHTHTHTRARTLAPRAGIVVPSFSTFPTNASEGDPAHHTLCLTHFSYVMHIHIYIYKYIDSYMYIYIYMYM